MTHPMSVDNNSPKDMFVLLNALLKAQGKTPLKSWKQSRAKLQERILKEKKAIASSSPTGPLPTIQPTLSNHTPSADKSAQTATPKPAEASEKTVKVKSTKVSVASVCRQMISDGADNDKIHEALKEHAAAGKIKYDDTKKWYITWYRSAIKRKS